MFVEHVFIVQINGGGELAEVRGSADGIARRYGDLARVIAIDPPSTPSASNWEQLLGTDAVLKSASAYIQAVTSEPDDDASQPNDIGVYVVSHGSPGSIGGLTAQQLAELLLALRFRRMRKLCLVACNVLLPLADKPTPTQGDIDQSFIGKLCLALKDHLRPIVAGWTKFVSVAHPGMDHSIYKATGAGKLPINEQAMAKAKGKKFYKGAGRSRLVTQGVRQEMKRAFQYRDGRVELVQLTEWHDVRP